jgi:hypothetical protein
MAMHYPCSENFVIFVATPFVNFFVRMLKEKSDYEEYLEGQALYIMFERLTCALILAKPDNVHEFLIDVLRKGEIPDSVPSSTLEDMKID